MAAIVAACLLELVLHRQSNLVREYEAAGLSLGWILLACLAVWRGAFLFLTFSRHDLPLIAVLQGPALGGGLELAATADFIVAERHVALGLPETGLGMVPGWSGTQRLVRRFGARAVKRMALGGEMFPAEAALALGLVDEVADTGGGAAAALALARRIAARGPVAVQIAKQLVNCAEGEEPSAALEMLAGSLTAYTGDLAEGVASFKGRRPPDFSDA